MGSIGHVFSNTVADGTNTNIVRPSDWNSIHAYTLQDAVSLAGNTAGVMAAIISGTLYLAGGNNVTLSQNANSVTISGGDTSQFLTTAQPPGAYLTTAMASNRGTDFVQATAAFAGTSASGTIGSGGISVSIGPYITTGALSNHSHGNPQLNLTNLSGTTASNSAGFTLSLSAAAPGAGGAVNFSAGTTSNDLSAIVFSNSGGVSFGLNGSTMTATVATNYQSQGAYLTTAQPVGAYLTTARASNDAIGLATALTANGVAWTANSAGLSLNVPAFLTTAQPPGAYLTTAMASNRGSDFVNVTAGVNLTGGIGATLGSGSVSFSVGAYLTTAALSNHSHGNPTLALTNLTGTTASASDGFTLSLSAAAPGAGGGATLVQFEPFPIAQAQTTTWAPAVGSWYFQPFVLPQNMAPGRINYLISNSNSNAGVLRLSNGASFASNTTGTRTLHHVVADTWALYQRGTGTNYTRLETAWSNTRALSITQSISIILTAATHVRVSVSHTVSYIGSIGTDGAVTLTTATASTSQSSASVSMATSAFTAHMSSLFNLLTGPMVQNVGITKSLTPGNYWLAGAYSTSQTTGGTSVGNILPLVHEIGLYGVTSQAYRGWGQTVSATNSQWFPGAGVFSVASNAAPATVAFSDIRSIASHVTQYFNILQSSL